jgi:hypothetical protein
MLDQQEREWRARLERDGLIEQTDLGIRTTRRWHAAVARAAFQLFREGEELTDVRVPIALALSENYADVPDASLALAVRVMFPIAVGELTASAR